MNDWRTRYNRERFNRNQGERFLLAKREGERLNKENYQKRIKIMNNENDSLDRHMPKTSKKTFLLYLLASPILALGAWLLLIWACLNTDAN